MDRTHSWNRVLVFIVGLLILAAGLLGLERRFEVLTSWDNGEVKLVPADVIERSEAPWIAGLVGLLLTLVVVYGLIKLLPKRAGKTISTCRSDRHGKLAIDLASLESSLATQLEKSAPLDKVSVKRISHDGGHIIQLRGAVDPRGDSAALAESAADLAKSVESAFDRGSVRVQVLVNGPTKAGKRTTPRVH